MDYIKIINYNKTTVKKLLKDKGFSARSTKEILNSGYLINGKEFIHNYELSPYDEFKIILPEEKIDYEPIVGPLDVVYEDDDILVINKPENITVNSKNQVSLANWLSSYFLDNKIEAKIRLVNRLDMNTSGLLMVAKNKYSFAYYQNEIEENRFIKKYLAEVEGRLDIDKLIKVNLSYNDENKTYEVRDKGKLAVTYFKTLDYDEKNDRTKILCDIKTGKTHQIRASLSYLSHPIVGDRLYGSSIEMNRFLLHCYYIKFNTFLYNKTVELNQIAPF